MRYRACHDRMPEASGTDRQGQKVVLMHGVRHPIDAERLYDAAEACPVFAIELRSS
jgi:ferredoxin